VSSLLLVGGATYALAAVLGYVVTAKRIPWVGLGIALLVLNILHAGKYEMRIKYWMPQSQSFQQSSVLQIPGMMADWFSTGIVSMMSGHKGPDVIERASLLHMLLLVQRATPDFIPYLDGETYALLPSMLVPRFIDPEKVESQSGLNMLSVRYGLQSVEATASTTIGWGLVAEAYANYGIPAVILAGGVLGALCGALMWLSAGAAPLSLAMFVTIAATLVLFSLELDFSYLLTTISQSVGAVVVFAALPKIVKGRRRRVLGPSPAATRPATARPTHSGSLRDPL
jgi:hypothetical protein